MTPAAGSTPRMPATAFIAASLFLPASPTQRVALCRHRRHRHAAYLQHRLCLSDKVRDRRLIIIATALLGGSSGVLAAALFAVTTFGGDYLAAF